MTTSTPLPADRVSGIGGYGSGQAPWRPTRGRRGSALIAGWPIVIGIVLVPVWWVLGLTGVILPALVLPLLATLILRRRLHAPRGFGLYLLFLVWCMFSATRISDPRQGFSLAYRGSLYVAAGLLFLYILNTGRDTLSAGDVVKLMAAFFSIVVVGGLIGMVIPNVSFTTLAHSLLPATVLRDSFVSDLVAASTSSGRAFAAYPIYRPKAPFIYSNEWGAAYAMSLPFGIAALSYVRSRITRDLLFVLLLLSIFPLVFSLNRGAWLSAAAAMLYATLRLSRGRNAQLLKAIALGALFVGAIAFVTPLGEIVQARLLHGYGDAHRALLYRESLQLVSESPFLGYGAPVLIEGNLSAGTHGQLWTILVSQGVPGVLFFVGWLGWALWSAAKRLPEGHPGDPNARFWCEVAIFTAIVAWREWMIRDAPPVRRRRRRKTWS
jgi:polysaccharide biosynthesis protein PslJ